MRRVINIKTFFNILLLSMLVLLFANPVFANNASCQIQDCSKASKCTGQTDGYSYVNTSEGRNRKSDCMKKASENGCLNTVPVSWAGSYTTIGRRGNNNHYGNDLGASGKTDIVVLAAADGEVKFAKTTGCSGRTIAIEHNKGCKSSNPKKSDKFTTIYRHLYKYIKASGNVKKGQEIGIEGGSNSGKGGSHPACDNPAQKGETAGCALAQSTCGSKYKKGNGYYAIHLHFEIWDAPLSASSGTKARPDFVLRSDCQDLQTICGGCSSQSGNIAKECQGSSSYSDSNAENYTREGTTGSDGSSVDAEPACQFADYIEGDDACLFCGLFRNIYNTASKVALVAHQNLAVPSKNLVMIGFLIWLVVYLLKQISSYEGADTGEMIKGILFQGFRVAVVVIILSGAIFQVMDLTLNPVMKTGMNFIHAITPNFECNGDAEYMQNIVGYGEGGYTDKNISGGLSVELGKSIICSIKTMEDQASLLIKLGKYSICIAFHDKAWFDFIPDFGYFTSGLVMWLAGLCILIAFPWCLIDCILQLCITAGLVPCAIAAFAFKITAKYLIILWNFFMNALFNLVFMALIIFIINSVFLDWVGLPENANDPTVFINGSSGWAWWGVNIFKCLACCFFCWTFFDEAKTMAEQFADSPGLGGSKGIGRMAGGTLGQTIQNYGAKPAWALTETGARAAGSAINSAVGNEWRSGVNHFKGRAMLAFGGKRILDENGNTIGYRGNFNLFGFNHNRTVTKDANGVWSQTKETTKRSATDKAFETVKDANGNVLKDQLFDANGNAVKDKNGNNVYVDRYEAKRRMFGITGSRVAMQAVQNADGSISYKTADGRNTFTMGGNGKITSYKTRFTTGDNEHAISQNATVRTTNDAFMRTREIVDGNGQVLKSDSHFMNESAKYLIEKDGSINVHAFNQMKNGAASSEAAAAYMVDQVMQQRGLDLPSTYANRDVKIEQDGSLTIQQTNLDGSTQVIKAEMMSHNDKTFMVLNTKTTDTNGNITINTSNGIQSKLETFRKQDDGSYTRQVKMGFTEYMYSKNKALSPLNRHGEWGNSIDRDQAMLGFTEKDYQMHINQLNNSDTGKNRYLTEKGLSQEQVNDILNGSDETSTTFNEKNDKAHFDENSPQADDRAKGEERQSFYASEEQDKLKKEKEDLHREHLADEERRQKLVAERDALTQQFNDLTKQISTIQSTLQSVALSDAERSEYQKLYTQLTSQYQDMAERLRKNRAENNETIREYNRHAEQHNGALDEHNNDARRHRNK